MSVSASASEAPGSDRSERQPPAEHRPLGPRRRLGPRAVGRRLLVPPPAHGREPPSPVRRLRALAAQPPPLKGGTRVLFADTCDPFASSSGCSSTPSWDQFNAE